MSKDTVKTEGKEVSELFDVTKLNYLKYEVKQLKEKKFSQVFYSVYEDQVLKELEYCIEQLANNELTINSVK